MLFHLGFRLLYGKVNSKTIQTVLEKELQEHYLAKENVLGKKKINKNQQIHKTNLI